MFQFRDFLEKVTIPHTFIEARQEGAAILQRYDLSSDGPGDLPAVIIGGTIQLTRNWLDLVFAGVLPRKATPCPAGIGARSGGSFRRRGSRLEGLDTAILELRCGWLGWEQPRLSLWDLWGKEKEFCLLKCL